MALKGAFRFHSVGQGLFYSGLLTDVDGGRKGLYSFVYDCGASSSKHYLRREIDDFKPLLQRSRHGRRRVLDLLVISHMHDDHVNGLEYLLEGLEVDTVIMPYADQTIRLLARAESSDESRFLRSFYADPIDWFSSRGVNRIMLIGSELEGHQGAESQDFNGEGHPLYVDRRHVLSTSQVSNTELVHLNNDVRASLRYSEWHFHFRNLRLPVVSGKLV